MSNIHALKTLGTLSKGDFESYMDFKYEVTDKQWSQIVDDIDGRTSNYLDDLLENISKDFEEGFYDEE